MGQRSWIKYLGIASAFAGVGMRIYSWAISAQAPDSEAGEEISASEIAALSPVITEAINSGLQAADVPLIADVKLFPLE